jgi:2-aminoadipate transaminase
MTQATVYEFLRRGNFESNIERVNGLLRVRRDAMLEALDRHAPEGAVWTRPEGGYFIWLDLEHDAPSLAAAQAAGVTFVEGKDFFADGSGAQSMRLAFSYVSTDEITEGVARLAPLLAGAEVSV